VELLLGLGALKRKTIYCKVSEERKGKSYPAGPRGTLISLILFHYMLQKGYCLGYYVKEF